MGSTVFIMLIFLLLIALLLLFIYMKRAHSYWIRKGFEQIEPEFLFGNVKEIALKTRAPIYVIQDLYKEIKQRGLKYVGIYALLDPALVVVDFDLIKRILIKDYGYFSSRGEFGNPKLEPLSGTLVILEGEKWKSERQKLTPTYSPGKMKLMFNTMIQCTSRFEELINDYIQSGKEIEMKEVFTRLIIDIVGDIVYGVNCNCLKDPDSEFIKYANTVIGRMPSRLKKMIVSKIPLTILNALKIRIQDENATKFFIKLVKDTVEFRDKNNVHRNDFLQFMMELRDGEFTMNQIATHCFTFFNAGHETSSKTAAFVMYNLALHQDIQEKLRETINEVLEKHDNKLTYDAMQEMTYTDKCIFESMRMYGIAYMLRRICTKDYNIPGTNLVIEKGTGVWIPNAGFNYDPEYYPEPEKYDPDKFDEDRVASRPNFTFMPFGDGPRNCIASRFGLMQTKLAVIAAVRKFRFKLNKRTITPIEFDPRAYFASPKGGIWLDFERI